jgi:hypothetical protein
MLILSSYKQVVLYLDPVYDIIYKIIDNSKER